MKLKTVRLDDNTRSILLRSQIDGTRLKLPEQLERTDYQRVAKAIEAAGGKWNRSQQCHVFPHPVRETLDISDDTVSVTNVQQTYQFFPTPPSIAEQLAEHAELYSGVTLLEPSAGTGNLVKAALANGVFRSAITAVEIQERFCDGLRSICDRVVCADFLQQTPQDLGTFERVIMNPPFSMGDDIKHIRHALNFVEKHGLLVSVLGAGPKQRQAFESGQLGTGVWHDLPPNTFRGYGTEVSTAFIVLIK